MGRARQGSFAFFNALAQDYATIVPVTMRPWSRYRSLPGRLSART